VAKEKLEERVEELTNRLGLEKKLRVNTWSSSHWNCFEYPIGIVEKYLNTWATQAYSFKPRSTPSILC